MSISKLEKFFLDVHKRRRDISPDFFKNEKYDGSLHEFRLILRNEFSNVIKEFSRNLNNYK